MLKDLIRVSRRHPCPICGKGDWCAYNSRIAICMRIPSNAPTKNGGWVHQLSPDIATKVSKIAKQKKTQMVAKRQSDEILNKVYRKLLSLLPLQSHHYQHLRERGMTDNEIERFNYKSLPAGGREKILSYFDSKEVERVPGFGLKRGQLTLAGRPGLLIPVISPEGHIVSLVIRPDIQREGRKYVVLSSSWLENGASPGARLHLAIPDQIATDALWITEGPLKANMASIRLKAKVLAVPGVSNWGEILKLNLPQKAVLAYDTDYDNFQVKYHARKLANALIRRGVDLRVALWQGYKGIDDALVGGVKIQLLQTGIKPLPQKDKTEEKCPAK